MKRTEKKAEAISFPGAATGMEAKPKRGRKPRATKKKEAEVAAVNENITEEESAPVSEITTEGEAAPVNENATETESAPVSEITAEEESVPVSENTTEEESVSEPENITETETEPVPENIPETEAAPITEITMETEAAAESENITEEEAARVTETVTEEEAAPVSEITAEEEPSPEPESATEEEPIPVPEPAPANPAAVQVVDSPFKVMKQEFQHRAQVIKEQMQNIQNAFITIGFQLHWIRNNNMYRVLNYKNVYEYAEKEYGIKKTTCCNFISIIENYADRDENGEVIESISGCYKNYSASQLVAMLGLPDEVKQQVSPDMSVRAIKRLKQDEPEAQEKETAPVEAASVRETATVKETVPVKEAAPVVETAAVKEAAAPVEAPTAAKETAPEPSGTEEAVQHVDVELPEETKALDRETVDGTETVDVKETEETVSAEASLPEEETSASTEEATEDTTHRIPDTLMEIDSYRSYRNMADKLDGMIKSVFSAGGPVRVRIVCVQG